MRNNSLLFFVLVIIIFSFSFLTKVLLNTDDLVVSSLAEQLSQEQIVEILKFKEKWQWLEILMTPILLLIKVTLIAAILDIGCFFFDKEIKYKKLINIVVKAEFVFLLAIISKIIWFYFFYPNSTLEDIQYFYPLSLLNILDYQGLETWSIYPFQVLNLFELAYWIVLAFLIGKELDENTDKGFSIVLSSYGIGLLIWVVGVMFFTLNMS